MLTMNESTSVQQITLALLFRFFPASEEGLRAGGRAVPYRVVAAGTKEATGEAGK